MADLQQRWKDNYRNFFEGLLEQVKVTHDQRMFTRDVLEYMDMRRRTIGAYPAIILAEYDSIPFPQPCSQAEHVDEWNELTWWFRYALDIHLSQDIVDHPSVQECMCVSADLVLL